MADVVAIGGANIDIKAKALGNVLPGTSNPGTVSVSPGGVARNIAHNLAVLGE
ncbi:MAG: PfkB family carbohydrate kinase, partial [Aestuariivirga sp.]